MDIGVLQIRRHIWQYFHCYPKLGLEMNYGRLNNKGNLIGALVYVTPQYDYQASFELVPILGIGASYLGIPQTLAEENHEEKDSSDEDKNKIFYRKGFSLTLSCALCWRIKLTPKWQFNPRVAFNYISNLGKAKSKEAGGKQKGLGLGTYTLGMGISYNPNPSHICYPNLKNTQRNRIDVGFLSSFKKNAFTTAKEEERKKGKDQEERDNNEKYYYVGGIYGHWSLRLCKNHALTFSTEWIKDWAIKEAVKHLIKQDHLLISLLVGHEFLWNRLIFGQQLGFYLINNSIKEKQVFPFIYTRLGLSYRITDFFLHRCKPESKTEQRTGQLFFRNRLYRF